MAKNPTRQSKAMDTSDDPTNTASSGSSLPSNNGGRYTVVARRYRPRSFDELIGQQTVAAALKSAIESERVGHAYLFTGARGVGKTSTARIFAKALNLSKSSGTQVDSDLVEAIDSGEDMDVIEIDGASNRGIEEIRQLRANATVRPSRAAYKIYIIDEVHMLTLQAFNALLKTLEEPPEHVKFIFCTTDPEKIPITVLSRCQRFDFPPIKLDDIKMRLAQICEAEGVKVDDDALRLIARRANGSMRDSQSLLEQLLSFSSGEITIASVHAMLGTADDSRLSELVQRLIDRDAGTSLQLLEIASQSGVDAGQMAEQLLGYLRDIMAIGIGASEELLRTANPSDVALLREMATRWGTMTLLSAIQILDETLVKMRHSVQSRILLEVCLVQICHLQDLQGIANLAQAIRENAPMPPVIPARVAVASNVSDKLPANQAGQPAVAEQKKNVEPSLNPDAIGLATTVDPPSSTAVSEDHEITDVAAVVSSIEAADVHQVQPSQAIDSSNSKLQEQAATNLEDINSQLDEVQASSSSPIAPAIPHLSGSSNDPEPLHIWKQATIECDGMLSDCAHMAIAIEADQATNTWEVVLPPGCDFALQILMESSNFDLIRVNLQQRFGLKKTIRFKMASHAAPTANGQASSQARPAKAINQSQLIRNVSTQPLIAQLIKTLNAEVTKVDVPVNYTLKE